MATEEQLAEKVEELREHFLSNYKGKISDGESYDIRDVEKIKEDDKLVQCYMRSFSVDLDLEAPAKQIDMVLKWRKAFGVLDIAEDSIPRELWEKQYLYWKGMDKNDKKILILKVAKHKKKAMNEETKKHITYMFEKHHSQNPGERIVFVFDFTGAGVSNVDLDIVKFIINALSSNFPSLLAYILLFEMPFILQAVWRIIKSWLTEEQKERILFAKKKDIQQYINADQLEEDMLK